MIVLVSGKQGSGKTTLTAQFSSMDLCPVFKFADPLYEMHNAMWDVMDRYGVLVREDKSGDVLQALGDLMRKRDPMVFVKCALTKATRLEAIHQYVFNDDTRFVNEFNAFPEALKIRLECDRDARKARAVSWRTDENHKSEIELDEYAAQGKFDLYIDTNFTTPEQIRNMVADRMEGRSTDRGHYEIPEFREKFYKNIM